MIAPAPPIQTVKKGTNNLQLLLETPKAILRDFAPDRTKAWSIIRNAILQKRLLQNLNEVKVILEAYGIPVIATTRAQSEDEAVSVAEEIGFPVVLKIDSEKIFHKVERGGVILNLKDQDSVRNAFRGIREVAVSGRDPEAHVLNQPIVVKHGHELVIKAKEDPHSVR